MTLQPELSEIYYQLAQALQKKGEFADAVKEYRHALQLKPDFFWAQYHLAQSLLQLEKYQDASHELENAIALNPNFSWSYYSLGDALLKLDKYEEAAKNYRLAIEKDPDFFGSYHNLGDALFELEKYEEASQAYQHASQLNPDFFWSNFNLGKVLQKLERYQDAISACQKAILLNPNEPSSFYLCGEIYQKLEQWEDVIVAYQKSLELKPDIEWVYHHLGECFQKLKQWDNAILAYEKSLLLKSDEWAYHRLGEIYQKLKRWEDAIALYQKALQFDPHQASYYYKLGEIYFQLKKWDDAVKAYHKVLQLDPKLPIIAVKLADVLLRRAQPYLQQVIQQLRLPSLDYPEEQQCCQAFRIEGETADFYVKLGNIWAGQNHIEPAMLAYQMALQFQPGHVDIYRLLKRVSHYKYLDVQSKLVAESSRHAITDILERFIAQVVKGKTFAEVGGLWGTVNEKVSVAYRYGAASLTMIDVTPFESELWQKLRDRMKSFNISNYQCISQDISQVKVEDIGEPYHVIHCAGVLYHHPHPLQMLKALRALTKEYLILSSAITPELISNEYGCYEIPSSGVIFIPALPEKERIILKADWQKCVLKYGTALGIIEPTKFELNNFAAWWWLPTAAALKSMCEVVGFEVLDSGFLGHSHAITLLLQVKS
jgi:tetratricopeptide (TPR) repeat protein